MKYECDLIKDLLPLYCDQVCSAESGRAVEEHLTECDSCKALYIKMQDYTYDDRLRDERKNVLQNHSQQIKRKALLAGAVMLFIPVLVCLIVNLSVSRTLDWFFIVLTSIMLFASVTLVPFGVRGKKGLKTLCSFTASLLILLLTCSIYSNGNWFLIAASGVLLGLSVIFLPYVLHELPLHGAAAKHKGLMAMAGDTVLLYLLIVFCGIYVGNAGYWRPAFLITTVTAVYIWGIFVLIRYLRANAWVRSGLCCILSGVFLSMIHDIIGWIMGSGWTVSLAGANLRFWNTNQLINSNSYLLILLTGTIIGGVLLLVGWFRRHKKNEK